MIALRVSEKCNFADYFVIATCATRPQLRAVSGKIQQRAKDMERRAIGVEGHGGGSWTLLDYGDLVVHLFTPDSRQHYRLERLWGDASQVDWQAETPVKA